ncbi:MAG TPA: DUF1269 domain-containing protein [Solirubrobacteraceae bacterium]|jgi:uncharacterized membrane protein|nr:DUF1269 domain-containing protein [Solirubrobacteraceae bacterium]
MSDLVAIAYPDVATARDVAANIVEAQKSHVLDLDDLVVVEREQDGKVKLHQPSAAAGGALGGAFWGGLIGLIFFVPFVGIAIGAATGAAAGALSDYGVDDNFMKQLGENLQPGQAAVIALLRRVTVDKVLPQIKTQGTIIQTSLDNDTEQRLADALQSAGTH